MTSKITQNGRSAGSFLLTGQNQVFLHIMEVFLARQSASAAIYTAGAREEALFLAHALKPAVMLVDLDLATADGLSIIAGLRSDPPRAVIIALTLLESYAYRELALATGADDFVLKDQIYAILMATIERASNGFR